MEIHNCSKCGSECEYKQGVGKKTNKPYKGYRCLNERCGNFDFINEQQPIHQPQPTPVTSTGTQILLTQILDSLKRLVYIAEQWRKDQIVNGSKLRWDDEDPKEVGI